MKKSLSGLFALAFTAIFLLFSCSNASESNPTASPNAEAPASAPQSAVTAMQGDTAKVKTDSLNQSGKKESDEDDDDDDRK